MTLWHIFAKQDVSVWPLLANCKKCYGHIFGPNHDSMAYFGHTFLYLDISDGIFCMFIADIYFRYQILFIKVRLSWIINFSNLHTKTDTLKCHYWYIWLTYLLRWRRWSRRPAPFCFRWKCWLVPFWPQSVVHAMSARRCWPPCTFGQSPRSVPLHIPRGLVPRTLPEHYLPTIGPHNRWSYWKMRWRDDFSDHIFVYILILI